MAQEDLVQFLQAVQQDAALQERLQSASDPTAVLALAQEIGFPIAAADLTHARGELSDEELEGVAGGADFWWQVDPGTWRTLVIDGLPD